MEMPRFCSISIQSEVTRRRSPRAFTAPADCERPAVEQELLGEGGLARVRVADDGEGAPARGLLGRGGHGDSPPTLASRPANPPRRGPRLTHGSRMVKRPAAGSRDHLGSPRGRGRPRVVATGRVRVSDVAEGAGLSSARVTASAAPIAEQASAGAVDSRRARWSVAGDLPRRLAWCSWHADPRHRRAGRPGRRASARCSRSASPSSTEPTGSSTSPRATSGVVPAILAILLMAPDAPGGAPDWMTGIPYLVALVVGLVAAIVLGFLVETPFIHRFSRVAPTHPDRRHDRRRPAADRPRAVHAGVVRVQGASARRSSTRPSTSRSSIGGVIFNDNDLMVFLVVPLLLGGLAWFLRATRIGIAIRARRRALRSGRHARRPGGTDPDHRVGHHRPCSPSSRCSSAPGVISVPDRQRARRSRCWSAPWPPRDRPHGRASLASRPRRSGSGSSSRRSCIDTGRDLYVFPVLFVSSSWPVCCSNRAAPGQPGRRRHRVDLAGRREIRPIPTELRSIPEVRCGRSPCRRRARHRRSS